MYLLKTVKTDFWKIGQHPFLMLSDRSGIFFRKQDSFTIINQMKIHGILSAQRVVPSNCICNLSMCFDCLFVQSPTGCFNKQRNRVVNDRNQTGNNNIFAAQCNGCVEFNVLLGVIIMPF